MVGEGCPSVDREVMWSSHESDLGLVSVETVCYIKLHSVFSVLLLELLFTGTTQPTALPWVHGEPSSNCPHSHSASRLSRADFFRTYWWCFWQNDFTFPVKSHHIRKANNLWWEMTCAMSLPSRELSGQAKFRDEQFGALLFPSLPSLYPYFVSGL